MKDRQTV